MFFSVSGETKELSDERSSIGLVLGRHTSNTETIIFCISILFIYLFLYIFIIQQMSLLFIYYYYYHFYVIGFINYLCISCNAMLDVLCMF